MHYIIGTKISTGRDQRDPRRRNRTPKEFQTDKIYELFHIKKERDSDKMRYVFVSTDREDAVGLTFDTITEADKFIARQRREDLPNYEEVYSRNTS